MATVPEDLIEDEELAEFEDDEIIRAKWTMDDAATLPEAAQKLRDEADRIQRLHDEGWRLREPVSDDYGLIYKP